MRAFVKYLGKYCTIVSTKQFKEAQESGNIGAKITVEFHQNINDQKTKPFYKTVGKAEIDYEYLKL
jgi:hypothetical protein